MVLLLAEGQCRGCDECIDGDMLLPDLAGLQGRIGPSSRWSNRIEYLIEGKKLNPIRENITKALDGIQDAVMCLQFIPLGTNVSAEKWLKDQFIVFHSDSKGCFSHVGRRRKGQTYINIGLEIGRAHV